MENKTQKKVLPVTRIEPWLSPPACWTTIDPEAARGPDRSAKWLCVEHGGMKWFIRE